MKNLILVCLLLDSVTAFAEEVCLDEIQFQSILNMATYSLKAPVEKKTKLNGFVPLAQDGCWVEIDRSQNGAILFSIGESQFVIHQSKVFESMTVIAPSFISLIEQPSSDGFKALQIRSTSDKSIMWFAIFELAQRSDFAECSIRLK